MVAILVIIIFLLVVYMLSRTERLRAEVAEAKRRAEQPTWQRLTRAERNWLRQMPLTDHEKELIENGEGDPERERLMWRWKDRFGPDDG